MALQGNYFPTLLLDQVNLWKTDSFTGVGVVFYSELKELPSAALGNDATPKPWLPVSGADAIARTLADVSNSASPWHDGFHMIDIRSQTLTHLSQFLAPPLHSLEHLPKARPSGARQMTALISSMIEGIDYVGVLSTSGEIVVYQNGQAVARVITKHE
jgi:hypothetical protein